MKGFIVTRTLTVLCAGGGLALSAGCAEYRNIVDPCYPQRYEFAARHEEMAALAPQVFNGHVLDQTIWNYQFEPGTDKLTPGGMEHLAYLARRRPYPDAMIYLQTAQDIPYDPAAPGKFSELRGKLDASRIQAIQSYLTAETAGRNLVFQVAVHDPAEVGLNAVPVQNAVNGMYTGFRGIMPFGGPSGAGGGGSATAAASSLGGGGGSSASAGTPR
jgi:hypothetical protein